MKRNDFNTHIFKYPNYPGTLPDHQRRHWDSPWDPRDAFHIFGCEWNQNEIVFYVDGIEVQRHEDGNLHFHQAFDVILSMGVRSPLDTTPSSAGFPTTMEVDYIRVWQRQ